MEIIQEKASDLLDMKSIAGGKVQLADLTGLPADWQQVGVQNFGIRLQGLGLDNVS